MTRDLDALRAALKAAPTPNGDAKARAIAAAMENFDRLQTTADSVRFRPDRARVRDKVYHILHLLTLRPALAATTSVAVLVISVAVIPPLLHLRTIPPSLAVPDSDASPPTMGPELESNVQPGDLAPPEAPMPATALQENAEDGPAGELAFSESSLGEAQVADGAPYSPADNTLSDETGSMSASGSAFRDEGALDGQAAYNPRAPLPQTTDVLAVANRKPVRTTALEPVSTFLIDGDIASWAEVRSALNAARLPSPDQIRIEEMVNYFPYDYPPPSADEVFGTQISVMPTPWNSGTRLVTIGIQGAFAPIGPRPPLNLVVLIDWPEFMGDQDQLQPLKRSFALILSRLSPEDQVAIVANANPAYQVLAPTIVGERDTILRALDSFAADDSPMQGDPLDLAIDMAASMSSDRELTRLLWVTADEFAVRADETGTPGAAVASGESNARTSPSVPAPGQDRPPTAAPPRSGNGNASADYIGLASEALRALFNQLSADLFPIARGVQIQVEWNPDTVTEYRLIAYETGSVGAADFANRQLDGAEIAAGTQVTAIYEVTMAESEALPQDLLRNGEASGSLGTDELGFLRMRWQTPGFLNWSEIQVPLTGAEEATSEARFAAAIAGFGQLLEGSIDVRDWGWEQVIELALANRGNDPFGYRAEAIELMRLAKGLAAD